MSFGPKTHLYLNGRVTCGFDRAFVNLRTTNIIDKVTCQNCLNKYRNLFGAYDGEECELSEEEIGKIISDNKNRVSSHRLKKVHFGKEDNLPICGAHKVCFDSGWIVTDRTEEMTCGMCKRMIGLAKRIGQDVMRGWV